MNDPIPKPVVSVQVQAVKVSTNSIFLIVNTIKDEILINPVTGHRAETSTPLSYKSLPINFSLPSCSHHHIQSLLHDQLHSDDNWLCDHLVPKISTAAINAGFMNNGVELTVGVTVTYQYVHVEETSSKESRMVRLGSMKAEELKSFNMETESCSICLQSLVSSLKTEPTRMSCSHVFHSSCLVEWLKRKNTCPMCRTVLYDR
ncbi:putative transcription factor C2H2 family [Arabidopsis thaliana]